MCIYILKIYWPQIYQCKLMRIHAQKKRGANLMLVPRHKGLRIARLVETSNAESPTPMLYIKSHESYIGHTDICLR